tara:strand:- start:29878 stop:30513 length:636 start_codon:yes stop_codon:yes gene_type:complete
MLNGAQNKSKKDGIHQFLKSFPWWYSLVKWLVPIAVGATSALLIGGVTTGMIGLPAFLSGLGALPVLYANISAFGAFSLLGISMITVATITGGAAGFMTRIALFPLVETMAHENFKAVGIFQALTLNDQEKRFTNLRAEYDGALVELDTENKRLKQEVYELTKPSATDPVLLSGAAKYTREAEISPSSSNDELGATPKAAADTVDTRLKHS